MSSGALTTVLRAWRCIAALAAVAGLGACTHTSSWTPRSGPSTEQLQPSAAAASANSNGVKVIALDPATVRRLAARENRTSLAESLERARLAAPASGSAQAVDLSLIGRGDQIEISLWEAPPALLFGSPGAGDTRGLASGRAVTLPEQMVDSQGELTVPFVGRMAAANLTPAQLQQSIERRLTGKANQPQALVRITRPATAMVTVVGEVTSSLRMPLSARGEHLLDALAAAGGVRQPVGKVSVQLTRGAHVHTVALDALIRDPVQNVALQPGDVITALAQPLSFTVLGATGRNEEVPFEAQGISLAQALARAGGLNDSRADVQGVFVFRMEEPSLVDSGPNPLRGADGKVPVVYALDLGDPAGFFLAQGFSMAHRDLIYVANARGAELQKFLNLLWGAALPALGVLNQVR
jgi:polysaccharide export outer membrane protein